MLHEKGKIFPSQIAKSSLIKKLCVIVKIIVLLILPLRITWCLPSKLHKICINLIEFVISENI